MGLTGGGGLHKICGPRIYRRRQPGWVEQDRWASRGHHDQDAGSAIRRVLAASPMSSVRGSVQVPRASTMSRYADLLLFLLTWCFLEIVCHDTTLVQSCTIRTYSIHLVQFAHTQYIWELCKILLVPNSIRPTTLSAHLRAFRCGFLPVTITR
jgi:hypothetical protein